MCESTSKQIGSMIEVNVTRFVYSTYVWNMIENELKTLQQWNTTHNPNDVTRIGSIGHNAYSNG